MERYDIYFRGELLEGAELAGARAALGQLFKASDATLDKLFSGKLQAIKRDCDKATALKYQTAMRKAGVKAVISAVENNANETANPAKPSTPNETEQAAPAKPKLARKAGNAAERIAALAAGPDVAFTKDDEQTETVSDNKTTADTATEDQPKLTVAPAGANLIDKQYLKPPVEVEPISHDYDIAFVGAQMSTAEPVNAPPAPDVNHMSMGEVGDDIPTIARFSEEELQDPDTSHIETCPAGTDFSDLVQPAEEHDMDLSDYSVAPTGATLGTPAPDAPPPPDTSHIAMNS